MFKRLCSACGHDSGGAELDEPCPACGQKGKFDLLFAANMEISVRGAGSVQFPPYSTNVDQTVIKTTGDVSVRFGAETHEYRFAEFAKKKLKLDDNWVQVNLRRDRRGLDILFGRRSEQTRSHYSYTARAEALYVRDHGSQLSRTLLFDARDGAFVPLVDHIDDSESRLRLELNFRRSGAEIVLDRCQLTPLPRRRPT